MKFFKKQSLPFLIYTACLISIIEYGDMLILPYGISGNLHKLMDVSLTVAILSPVLYFFIFQPLIHEIDKYKRSEEFLNEVISNIPFSVSWKNKNSVYLGCNTKFAEEAGIGTPENIVGKTTYDLIRKKEEAELFVMCDKEVMEKEEPIFNVKKMQLDSCETRNALLTSKIPIRGHDGNVIGVLDIQHKYQQT